jgi:putative glutamine amidotransferase
MTGRPIILVTPDVEPHGTEMQDVSSSLSGRYQEAVLAAGGLPFIMPLTTDRSVIAESVARAEAVMLTGGEDINPDLYPRRMAPKVRQTVKMTPDHGERDFREFVLIDEVFRQGKPLLAICRGQQILNVALGGTLYADIPSEIPGSLQHRRIDKRCEPVHEVRLTEQSLLAKITRKPTLDVNSTHHQAVAEVAPPLRATAVSSDGVVEGLELRPEAAACLPFLVSVQFHPERLADRFPEHANIFRALVNACLANRNKL